MDKYVDSLEGRYPPDVLQGSFLYRIVLDEPSWFQGEQGKSTLKYELLSQVWRAG